MLRQLLAAIARRGMEEQTPTGQPSTPPRAPARHPKQPGPKLAEAHPVMDRYGPAAAGPDIDAFLRLPIADQIDAISREIEGLPDLEKRIIMDALKGELSRKWIPLPGPQTQTLKSPADIVLYGGSAGGGKGLLPDELVLTPTGWKEIGKLKVGSLICAPDGTVTRIIGHFHRGEQWLYRIGFSDGTAITCDEDHIWLAWTARCSRKIANERTAGEAGAKKWVTRDIFDHYREGGERLAIPVLSAPASFNVAGQLVGPSRFIGRPVPAYTLGVILGDGCISQKCQGVSFTSSDDQIAREVETDLGVSLSPYVYKGKAPEYRIPNAAIADDIGDLRLWGHKAESKSIPRSYLFAPQAERWALLQGLMDTDGWADADGDTYFCTVSAKLADGVTHLARSLGAIVSRREKEPFYRGRDGERVQCKTAYTLRIKIRDPERLFRLERKRAACSGKSPQSMGRFIESITPAGLGETICIAVEHPSNLFVVRDFIVTHNTDLILGLAITEHRRSLVMRREYGDLAFITDRSIEINGTRKGFAATPHPVLRTEDGRIVEYGAASKPGDEEAWQGRPHDLLAIDEAAQLQESQVRYLMGWVRSTDPGQRTRIILASNPPLSDQGQWMVRMFGPWLDPSHKNPAKAGDLRWFVTDAAGNDQEVDGPEKVKIGPRWIKPMSRTFIPANLSDNAYLTRTDDYAAKLDALPEPLRSAVRDGNFMAVRGDAAWQVIPSEWVRQAQGRWTSVPPDGAKMTCIAADIAQGGSDNTVLSARHGLWFAPLEVYKGVDTPDGREVATRILMARKNACQVVVDIGGGWGGDTVARLKDNQIPVVGFRGADSGGGAARHTGHGFANLRAEAWWRFKEALDPANSEKVMLPPDQELLADLCSARIVATAMENRGLIQIESKDDIRKRLGRSPDRADAVVMAWRFGGLYEYERKRQDRQHLPRFATVAHADAKRRFHRAGDRPSFSISRTRH